MTQIQLQHPVTCARAAWDVALREVTKAKRGDIIRAVIVNEPEAHFGDVMILVGRQGEDEPARCLVVTAKRLQQGDNVEAIAHSHNHCTNGIVDAMTAAGRALDSSAARSPMEVKSLMLCFAADELTAKSMHQQGADRHTIVLNESALRLALHPVEFEAAASLETIPRVREITKASTLEHPETSRK